MKLRLIIIYVAIATLTVAMRIALSSPTNVPLWREFVAGACLGLIIFTAKILNRK